MLHRCVYWQEYAYMCTVRNLSCNSVRETKLRQQRLTLIASLTHKELREKEWSDEVKRLWTADRFQGDTQVQQPKLEKRWAQAGCKVGRGGGGEREILLTACGADSHQAKRTNQHLITTARAAMQCQAKSHHDTETKASSVCVCEHVCKKTFLTYSTVR